MKLRVKVIRKSDRGKFVLRWNDPETGAERQATTDATTRAEALKRAGQLEQEILEERFDEGGRTTWEHARRRFESEKLPQLRPRTVEKYVATLNQVERLCHPKVLKDLDKSRISLLQAQMRKRGLQPASIHSAMASLKAFLRWCEDVGLMNRAPRFRMPSLRGTGKLMRGRPITDDEFQRMLEAVEPVVGPERAAAWERYLWGMWCSGLRVTESLHLYWDRDDGLRVRLDGRYPMLFVPAEFDKGGRDRQVPITPDFAALLEATPPADRRGLVFDLPGGHGARVTTAEWVSRTVARIGKRAGVVVDRRGAGKCATLHDLRRSFGARWAAKVPVHVLRELMRHAALATTMDYYVGQDADRSAALIWGSRG